MRHFFAFVLACIALVSHGAAAQERQAPREPRLTAAQLNGEWTGTLVLDNSSPRLTLVFDARDSTFTGKVYDDSDLMGEMEDGRISGNKVHFKLGRFDFTGAVTGARMDVDLIVYNGSTRKLSLTRTPSRGVERRPSPLGR